MTDDFLSMLDEPGNATSTNAPDEPDSPEDILRAQARQWLQAAEAVRYGASWPDADATPMQVHRALVDARATLDRMETVLAAVISFRHATASRAKSLELAAEDAWEDRAAADRRQRRDFEGARERYAWWNFDIRAQRLEARSARELAEYARDVHERVKLAYDGLNDTRRDLVARLTHLRWESSMEQ